MLNKYNIIICLMFIIMLLSFKDLYALGVGGYVAGNAGVSTLRAGDAKSSVDFSLGGGFIFDTAVGLNQLFNYRLGVGYENTMKSGNSFFDIWSIHKIAVSNTFGYAFFRSKHLRVWMGPQIEVGCRFNRITRTTKDIYDSAIIADVPPILIRKHSIDYSIFSLGFGAVLGININTDSPFSAGFEIGLNASLGVGPFNEKKREYVLAPGFFLPRIFSSKSRDIAFAGADAFTRVSFLYRLGEIFISETPQDVDVKIQRKI